MQTNLERAINILMSPEFDAKAFAVKVVAEDANYFLELMTADTVPGVEQTPKYDLILTSCSDKIASIRLLRQLFGYGLKEAKDLVDGVSSPIHSDWDHPRLVGIQRNLSAIGTDTQIVCCS